MTDESPGGWSGAELLDVLDHVPVLVSVWDAAQANHFANAATGALLGWTARELHAQPLPTVFGAAAAAHIPAILVGTPQLFEAPLVTADGRRILTQVSFTPLADGQGRRFCAVLTDVTGQAHAQRADQRNRARLALLEERHQIGLELDEKVVGRLTDLVTRLRQPATPGLATHAIDELDDCIAELRRAIKELRDAAHAPALLDDVNRRLADHQANLVLSGPLDAVAATSRAALLDTLESVLAFNGRPTDAIALDILIRVADGTLELRVIDPARADPPSVDEVAELRRSARNRGGTLVCDAGPDRPCTIEWRIPLAQGIGTDPTFRTWSPPVEPAGPPDRVTRPSAVIDEAGIRAFRAEPVDLPGNTDLLEILDALPITVAMWDAEQRLLFANRKAITWLGGETRGQILGRTAAELLGPAVFRANLPYADAAISGVPQHLTRSFVDGEGITRHTSVYFTPRFVAGAPEGMYVVVTDISARVAAAAEASASAARIAVLTEKQRIAEDLHDRVIQRFYAAELRLFAVESDPGAPIPGVVVASITDGIAELYSYAAPAVGDPAPSLSAACVRAVQQAGTSLGFAARLTVTGPVDDIAPALAAEVLSVLSEALSNVARHARASAVSVALSAGDELRVSVVDDGIGIDPSAPLGNGLQNLRARAARHGGSVEFRAGEGGRGTAVMWRVPVRAAVPSRR